MRVLIIGSGGREHALGWKIAQSAQLSQLYFAPGNPGCAHLGKCVDLPDLTSTLSFCQEQKIDLVVVGPEKPLVQGWCDHLRAAGIACFGPSKLAAQLEGSKAFAKKVMAETKIPTAKYQRFDAFDQACAYVKNHEFPLVVKADGLASGKGVTICQNEGEAVMALKEAMVDNRFGESGKVVVIEEFLVGREASFHVICDGKRGLALVAAQDHKALHDGNHGPNTGGMGTFAPSPFVTPEMEQVILEQIADPVFQYMAQQGSPFQGVLFIGLMLTWHGPKVLEFNVRFGDPETQVMMPLIESDLLPILYQSAQGQFEPDLDLKIADQRACVCVVCTAEGYPENPRSGDVIEPLPQNVEDGIVFHAGTQTNGEGKLVTAGGRVLGATAWRSDLDRARNAAYRLVEKVHFRGKYFRKDIGGHELNS
ncbi:MAG: phosphoribosylamine--glycine ligase [Acidobacteria bacterium]|nr:phosphoribosylamine--glycine ligase [Acidobacteriota bacterium]MCB9397074.1 phosphoribosylamine--glycine ligase [Acidobacteriota bacterium]